MAQNSSPDHLHFCVFFPRGQQFEEEQEEELRRYEPGRRETEADRHSNLQSLHRKLQENLILLVRRHKDATVWEVPHAEVLDTRDTLQQVCNPLHF